MSRIEERFNTLRSNNQKALVAFITAGDPDLESTRQLFSVIEKNGADIVELGVPFSDPLADGPVIQKSSQRSLKNGTTLKKIVNLVSEIRKDSELPIVLMSSFNPIHVYGFRQFVDDAVSAGVDGIIVPDLPPEESKELEDYANSKGLDMIFLLAPTSTPDRVEMVAQRSRGFIYYVSLTGTTGVRSQLPPGIETKLLEIRKASERPVLVGFGISGPEQARQASGISDGVIIGSAIVKLIEEHSGNPEIRDQKVAEFISSIHQTLKS